MSFHGHNSGWRRCPVKWVWRKPLQGPTDLIMVKKAPELQGPLTTWTQNRNDTGSGQVGGECGTLRIKTIPWSTIIRTQCQPEAQNIRQVSWSEDTSGRCPVTMEPLLQFSRWRRDSVFLHVKGKRNVPFVQKCFLGRRVRQSQWVEKDT